LLINSIALSQVNKSYYLTYITLNLDFYVYIFNYVIDKPDVHYQGIHSLFVNFKRKSNIKFHIFAVKLALRQGN